MQMDESGGRAWFVLSVSLHYADTFCQSGHFFDATPTGGLNQGLNPPSQPESSLAQASIMPLPKSFAESTVSMSVIPVFAQRIVGAGGGATTEEKMAPNLS